MNIILTEDLDLLIVIGFYILQCSLCISCKIMTSCCVQMRHSFVFKSPHKLHHKEDDDAGQSKGKQGLQQHQKLLMEKGEKETT